MADRQNVVMGGVRATLGVGMATLVTVLVAVLLTTFSVLALVSARADLHLSNKAAESMESYYRADSRAEQWLVELDARLSSIGVEASTAFVDGDYLIGSTSDGRTTLTRTFPMDNTRNLVVEVALGSGSNKIDILRWQVTATD